jgi:Flp pilus assembly pilin Flp
MFLDFIKDESGATLVEYTVLIITISMAIIIAVTLVGNELSNQLENVNAPITR